MTRFLFLLLMPMLTCTAIQTFIPNAEQSACSVDWFSANNFPETCPSDEAQFIESTYQAFEHGYMLRQSTLTNIWFYVSTTDMYYVRPLDMMRDAQPFTGDAPEGFMRPEGDFGTLWEGSAFVRDELGWAIGPPETYTMQYQESSTPMGTRLDRYRLFTLPDGAVVAARFGEF